MRDLLRILTLPALAFVLAACGSSETGSPPPAPENPFLPAAVGTDSTLEVVTWNLETFPTTWDPDDPRPLAELETLPLVIQAIAALDADVVAVQEIFQGYGAPGPAAFDAVAAALPGWAGYRSTDDGWMDLGFFYRVEGDLGDPAFTDLFQDEDYIFPRAPLEMQVTWKGQPLVIINNHLKALGGDANENRRRQACLLLEQYAETTWPDTPVIILGDLNDELDDPRADNVFVNFLDDTLNWRFADLPIAQDPAGLVSYPNYRSHIDHILISDELFAAADKAEALVAVVPLDVYLRSWSVYENLLSDHRPVALRLPLP